MPAEPRFKNMVGDDVSLEDVGGNPGLPPVDASQLLNFPGGVPAAHAASHENGGTDEINVAGLSGELADAQPPKTHAASHQHGGSDEIATAVAAANEIPKAGGTGKLDKGWLSGHFEVKANGASRGVEFDKADFVGTGINALDAGGGEATVEAIHGDQFAYGETNGEQAISGTTAWQQAQRVSLTVAGGPKSYLIIASGEFFRDSGQDRTCEVQLAQDPPTPGTGTLLRGPIVNATHRVGGSGHQTSWRAFTMQRRMLNLANGSYDFDLEFRKGDGLSGSARVRNMNIAIWRVQA